MEVTNPKFLKALLERHGLEAKKKLGQNFLCSPSVVDKIVNVVPSGSSVLEIGPGPGALTSKLSEKVVQVEAVELDNIAVSVLTETAPKANVHHQDILETDIRAILDVMSSPKWIVSNMPYNITGPLLGRIGALYAEIEGAVLMMQKEVGVRIKNDSGCSDRGWLSVYLQTFWDINKVCNVPPSSFYPAPKIDSIVLHFVPKKSEDIPDIDINDYAKFLKKAFAQPRKKLLSNLSLSGYKEKLFWENAFESNGIDFNIRPHQISNLVWILLFSEATRV